MIPLRRFLLALLALAFSLPAAVASAEPAAVTAVRETPAVFDDDEGRNADSDDPAIWVNPLIRQRSFFAGTKKNAGISAFDLKGRLLQDIPAPPAPGPDDAPGRFNNVDVLYGVRLGGVPRDIMVVSDRGRDQIRTYAVDPIAASLGRAPLRDVTARDVPFVFSTDQAGVNEQTTAYGIAAFVDHGNAYVIASRRSRTDLALLKLVVTATGVSYKTVDRLTLPVSFALPGGTTWSPCEDPGDLPQIEGMVVDRTRGLLYAGQEDVGIWRIGVSAAGFSRSTAPALAEKVREFGVPGTFDEASDECVAGADPGFGGTHISADVEGLTIGAGVLMASSQGDDTFAVFGDRGLGGYLGSFAVADGPATDSVQESDGAMLVQTYLGPDFPQGLFVTQDGDEQPGAPGRDASNFKLVPWQRIASVFSPPLPAPLTFAYER